MYEHITHHRDDNQLEKHEPKKLPLRCYRRALIIFAASIGMALSSYACGGELSCEEAVRIAEKAEQTYRDYDGDSLDRERELRDKANYAEGDARRACGA